MAVIATPETLEQNKAVIRRFSAEVWNQGDLDVMDELFDPQYVNHNPVPGQGPDRDGHKRVIASVRTGLPDIRETIEDMVAEGDRVVYRWTVTATHSGEVLGVPGTGKQIRFGGIEIYRLENGRIMERWGVFEQLSMLTQLGVIPDLH